MRILLIEPFFTGSHKQWAESLTKHSSHHIQILSLPGRHWKWRMHGGAISLAKQVNELAYSPELIIVSDMIDLALFKSLLKKENAHVPCAVYFHENQLTYPWSPTDQDVELKRDQHYSFINYTSALVADHCFFNSLYHLRSFVDALPAFLKSFPDNREIESISRIEEKSTVLSLGLSLPLSKEKKISGHTILWNHRWEYDKNPIGFFNLLKKLKQEELPFRLIVTGESYDRKMDVFEKAKEQFKDEIVHFGFVESREEYHNLLQQSNFLPVTSNQDFFGGSVVEAIAAGVIPILPNRLAYPEHIPEDYKSSYLYNSEDELLRMMKNFLSEEISRQEIALSNHVQRYDWKNIIAKYDEEFQGLII